MMLIVFANNLRGSLKVKYMKQSCDDKTCNSSRADIQHCRKTSGQQSLKLYKTASTSEPTILHTAHTFLTTCSLTRERDQG